MKLTRAEARSGKELKMKRMRQRECWAGEIIEFRDASAGARSWIWILYLLWRKEKCRVDSERDSMRISDSGACISWRESGDCA